MKKIHTGLSEAKLDEQSLRIKKQNHWVKRKSYNLAELSLQDS